MPTNEELHAQAHQMDAFLTANIPMEKAEAMKSATVSAVDAFLRRPEIRSRPLAVITSGGTSVPLEQRAVRSITNFSSGGRGAAMSEYLLGRSGSGDSSPTTSTSNSSSGYSVILLQKQGSLTPFHRVLDQRKITLLDVLSTDGGCVEDTKLQHELAELKKDYAELSPFLLTLTFDSVVEYLFQLKYILTTTSAFLEETGGGGGAPMLVLAAAVSDYFMPLSRMAAHKISGGDGLTLQLDCVPKGLGVIASWWTRSPATIAAKEKEKDEPSTSTSTSSPSSSSSEWFVVSFKLETDPEVLEGKARKNLTTYSGMNAVVANLLHSYKRQVDVFTLTRAAATGEVDPVVQQSTITVETTPDGRPVDDIEKPLVRCLREKHLGTC